MAVSFLMRGRKFCLEGGCLAVVSPQSWLFLGPYKRARLQLLENMTWHIVAQLGTKSFDTITGEIVNVSLTCMQSKKFARESNVSCVDVSNLESMQEKAYALKFCEVRQLSQVSVIERSDHRFGIDDQSIDLLGEKAGAFKGIATGDLNRFVRSIWEVDLAGSIKWAPMQVSVQHTELYGGRSEVVFWQDGRGELFKFVEEKVGHGKTGAWLRGNDAWRRKGVAISQMSGLSVSLYSGDFFDENTAVIMPSDESLIPAIYEYCSSAEFFPAVRRVDASSLKIPNLTLLKVPFDVVRWQEVAAERYPAGIPSPHSDDPTQWLFNGHPRGSDQPLQVAVARLLGYRWPRQTGSSFIDCPAITEPDGLESHADADGIVCLSALKGEAPAAQRLGALLSAAFGDDWSPARLSALLTEVGFAGKSLDDWLLDGFFVQHCELFQQRPFVWHVWDGRADGFHALVNYHRLAGPDGEGRRTLEKLIYTYLGDWIDGQRDAERRGVAGAEGRLAAALHLKSELEKIRDGEPPYDIFVRWKPLHRQAIGWEPDIDDGVRQNIRPFLTARPLPTGRRGDPCILRVRPKGSEFDYTAKPDRGKEPKRDKADYPWCWTWDGRTQDFSGGAEFDGNRWNGLHYTNAFKTAARARKGGG
jgi:hypothetical protein